MLPWCEHINLLLIIYRTRPHAETAFTLWTDTSSSSVKICKQSGGGGPRGVLRSLSPDSQLVPGVGYAGSCCSVTARRVGSDCVPLPWTQPHAFCVGEARVYGGELEVGGLVAQHSAIGWCRTFGGPHTHPAPPNY